MSKDSLLEYFERELKYLRRRGADFARRYPRVAGKLDLQSIGSADPHVERLIEAFAFLTARIHRRLDDDFPELSDALLSVIQPQFLAPVPSMAVAQLEVASHQGKSSEAVVVRAGATLRSPPVRRQPCLFRSCYDVECWPVRIASAQLGSTSPDEGAPKMARSVLRLRLESLDGAPLSELGLDSLRLFLHGSEQTPYHLYEFLTQQVSEIRLNPDGVGGVHSVRLDPRTGVRAVGFEESEGLLHRGAYAPRAYQLLLEYFVFPHKFLFVDLQGLGPAIRACKGPELDVCLYSEQLVRQFAADVDAASFQLFCTPVVNYFTQLAEPIRVTHRRTEYRVVPNKYQADQVEVCDVLSVRGESGGTVAEAPYLPYYSLHHGASAAREEIRGYYYPTRHESHRSQQEGTPSDVYLSFVELTGEVMSPSDEVLRVVTLCSNHDLPSRLPFGEVRTDFQLDGPLNASVRCLTKPTPSRRVASRRGLFWRLISQLALNQVTLTDSAHARDSLQELLRLFDFLDSSVTRQQIQAVLSLSGRPVAARLHGPEGAAMARGVELSLEIDPEMFVGGSIALFSAVLERFFGLVAPINSFTRLRVSLLGQEGVAYEWPARAGARSLV